MDKTEWPSEDRIQELRSEGVFAYSPFAAACLRTLALLGCVALLSSRLPGLINNYQQRLSAQAVTSELDVSGLGRFLAESLTQLGWLVLYLCAALIFAHLIALLLQARFVLRFRFGRRAFQRLALSRNWFIQIRSRVLWSLTALVLAAVLGGVLVFRALGSMLNLMSEPTQIAMRLVASGLSGWTVYAGLVLVVTAILAYGLAQLRFRDAQRVSRAEREAEEGIR